MPHFDPKQLARLGIFTSGGDAPGMNAALRAVVRTGIADGFQVFGIHQGFAGFTKENIEPLDLRSVANILQRGGTVLKTGRCPEFLQADYRRQAVENIAKHVDALICIGGEGSFHGAHAVWQEQGMPIVGVPATIDNDVAGTSATIGFDTAVNTALEAIDRIRDTAASHDRLFIVEVMGRESGQIAIHVGLAGGAEEIFIPEHPVTVDQAIDRIQRGIERGKTSSLLVAAEGQKPGRAYNLAEGIRKKSGFEAKVCVLGHVQRGGSPNAFDRILASRLGAGAVKTLEQGISDAMVGERGGRLTTITFDESLNSTKRVPQELIELAQILAN